MYPIYILLVGLIASTYAISEIENDDGSFSLGHSVPTTGVTGDSVYALLTKASGWTEESRRIDEENEILRQNTMSMSETRNLPYHEILRVVEAFMVLKGEIASRVSRLFSENGHIFRALLSTLASKIGTLHQFTLAGIVILRKILEFAVPLFGQWSVNVDVNSGIFG